MALVISIIRTLASVYSIVLIGRIFLEMLLDRYHPAVTFLRRITEPVLAPIRRYVPPVQLGGMAVDLAPTIALLLLWVIEQLLIRVLIALVY
jgi:YggT family protein